MRKSIPTKCLPNINKAIDCISANELLHALNTLQNIHKSHDQIDQDLNISFSQKDTFDPSDYRSSSQTNVNLKVQNKQNLQNTSSAQCHKIDADGKMDFQFYMTKKENQLNKSATKNTKKNNKSTINSNKALKNTIKVVTPSKNYPKKPSISPLTQRSMNNQNLNWQRKSTNDKKIRLKTQADENSNPLRLQNKKIGSDIKNKQNLIKSISDKVQKPKQTNASTNLTMHQRTLQYLKHKNQKLSKLTLQLELKKRQQQKQCTFKPQKISTCHNANIKPKYNDICSSYFQKNKKDRSQGLNQQVLNERMTKTRMHQTKVSTQQAKTTTQQTKVTMQQTRKDFKSTHEHHIIQACSRRQDQPSQIPQDQLQLVPITQAPKPKYRNQKFNTLLDMIN